MLSLSALTGPQRTIDSVDTSNVPEEETKSSVFLLEVFTKVSEFKNFILNR